MGQLTKNEIFALAVQRYSDTVFRAAMHQDYASGLNGACEPRFLRRGLMRL